MLVILYYDSFDPLAAFMVLTGILATFKSYPSLGDTALHHSLLALFPELVPRKQTLLKPNAMFITSC